MKYKSLRPPIISCSGSFAVNGKTVKEDCMGYMYEYTFKAEKAEKGVYRINLLEAGRLYTYCVSEPRYPNYEFELLNKEGEDELFIQVAFIPPNCIWYLERLTSAHEILNAKCIYGI